MSGDGEAEIQNSVIQTGCRDANQLFVHRQRMHFFYEAESLEDIVSIYD